MGEENEEEDVQKQKIRQIKRCQWTSTCMCNAGWAWTWLAVGSSRRRCDDGGVYFFVNIIARDAKPERVNEEVSERK